MKTHVLVAAMAASAAASPSPVQKRAITPITVKGNGTFPPVGH